MSSVNVEKLKKDVSKATNYSRRLACKGKKTLSYKMDKKILILNDYLQDMKKI
tara:strand:- start:5099 stop:5257 length:159 start_codon:yes stop_codon:yes gene_type:complete